MAVRVGCVIAVDGERKVVVRVRDLDGLVVGDFDVVELGEGVSKMAGREGGGRVTLKSIISGLGALHFGLGEGRECVRAVRSPTTRMLE